MRMHRLGVLVGVLFLAACHKDKPSSNAVPSIDGALTIELSPDRVLSRGETATITITVHNAAAQALDARLRIFADHGLTLTTPLADATIAAGGVLTHMTTVTVPDDDIYRGAYVSGSLLAQDGRVVSVRKIIGCNEGGRLHVGTDAEQHRLPAADLTLEASSRLTPGTDVTLTAVAIAKQAHPRFELSLLLPDSVTPLAGQLAALAPRSVGEGETVTLVTQVHVADSALDLIGIRAVARYGKPSESDHLGGAAVTLEDQP